LICHKLNGITYPEYLTMQPKQTLILFFAIFPCKITLAQDSLSTVERVVQFPAPFYDQVDKKTTQLDEQLTKKTETFLLRMSKHEQRLKKKLQKKDSTLAKTLFDDSQQKYQELIGKLKSKSYGVDSSTAILIEFISYPSSNVCSRRG
jgi:hypothetical protein